MWLSLFSADQRHAMLGLAHNVVVSDGLLDPNEEGMLLELKQEMGLSEVQELEYLELEGIQDVFQDSPGPAPGQPQASSRPAPGQPRASSKTAPSRERGNPPQHTISKDVQTSRKADLDRHDRRSAGFCRC